MMAIDISPSAKGSDDVAALTIKQTRFVERYIETGAASEAYRDAFDVSPSTLAATVATSAYRLLATPSIAARIRELRTAAAERAVVSAQLALVDLDAMANVDVGSLWRIEYRPCSGCHKFYDADLFAGRPMPDMSDGLRPHPSCKDIRAHQHVHMVPMSEWSPAALKLYDGLEMMRDGTLRPKFRDRNSIQDMVNRMLGAYLTRTENKTLTISASLPDVSDVSPADLLAMWKSNQRRSA